MIHRAILGSLERFIAIITEHFAGKWSVIRDYGPNLRLMPFCMLAGLSGFLRVKSLSYPLLFPLYVNTFSLTALYTDRPRAE